MSYISFLVKCIKGIYTVADPGGGGGGVVMTILCLNLCAVVPDAIFY